MIKWTNKYNSLIPQAIYLIGGITNDLKWGGIKEPQKLPPPICPISSSVKPGFIKASTTV